MRLSALSLLVPDYDPVIDWFTRVLGWTLTEDIQLSDTKRWVRVTPPGGGTGLILARAMGADQVAQIGQQGGGRVWLFLETDDFPREHTRMRDLGVVFEETPRSEAYGTVAVFRDPFGNRWDLIQFSDPRPA